LEKRRIHAEALNIQEELELTQKQLREKEVLLNDNKTELDRSKADIFELATKLDRREKELQEIDEDWSANRKKMELLERLDSTREESIRQITGEMRK
jgi:hypothetical protein